MLGFVVCCMSLRSLPRVMSVTGIIRGMIYSHHGLDNYSFIIGEWLM